MDSIEARLTDWASWAGGYGRGSGYSTPHARLIAHGTLLSASSEEWSLFPPEIERTERAIAQLRLKHPYLKKLIFYRYLYRQQPEEIATNFDKPKEHIERGLSRALDWLHDYLQSLEH